MPVTEHLDAAPPRVPGAGARLRDPFADVVGADLEVPLASGGSARYANLDSAASAPALAAVARRVAQVLPYSSSVHRGAGYASAVCTAVHDGAREEVARLVGARHDDHVVFTRNTTDALNLLAGALPADGDVLCLDVEHHANLLPWQRRGATVLRTAGTVAGTLERLEAALRRRSVTLVAVTGASNVTGEVLPLAQVARLAHEHGARIAVDAAQLAPHRVVDIAADGVDYVALSGHKLYAPYGAGALVGRADWLDAAQPYLAGGGAVRRVTPHATLWTHGPGRHEAGSPNVVGIAALGAAARELRHADRQAADEHEGGLYRWLTEGLRDVPGVTQLRIWSDSRDPVSVVSFAIAGMPAAFVAAYLAAEHGIGVRDGRFCAHRLLDRIAAPEGTVRASIGLGSRAEDVTRLLAAVEALVRRGPAQRYVQREGRFHVDGDARPLPGWLTSPGPAASARP